MIPFYKRIIISIIYVVNDGFSENLHHHAFHSDARNLSTCVDKNTEIWFGSKCANLSNCPRLKTKLYIAETDPTSIVSSEPDTKADTTKTRCSLWCALRCTASGCKLYNSFSKCECLSPWFTTINMEGKAEMS